MRARLLLRVGYDAPALDCRRVLRVLPPLSSILESEISIFPRPIVQEERQDRFGNRVLYLHHNRIERKFMFSFDAETPPVSVAPTLERVGLAQWKLPSRSVAFSPEFLALARKFRDFPPAQRAEKLNQLVFDSLDYISTANPRPLNATQIWMQKWGNCADFAHVLLALGRASGLPCRYVAGFGPAPGALHAWVEFGIGNHWNAFDPTHGRKVEGVYLPVAVGRDFCDCPPHQGSFRGSTARLEMQCELR